MWWAEVQQIATLVAGRHLPDQPRVHPTAVIETGVVLDEQFGPVLVGPRSRICSGALVRGPVEIGADCLVGNQAFLRGPAVLGDNVRIGFATEIKHALLGNRVSVGPMCFIADSRVDDDVYLGAMVRTSNHRLDGEPIEVRDGDKRIATGLDKLGCWIGTKSALGIQVIVLPGRVIAAGSIFEPRITISRNHPSGHYRAKQVIEVVSDSEKASVIS